MVQEGDTADLLSQALQGLNNSVLSTAEAQTNLWSDTTTNTKALIDNKTKVVDGTTASVNAQQAIENQARAIQSLMQANITGGMSTQQATDKANAQGAAFLAQIAKTDGAKSAIYLYAQQILDIPATAQTTMNVDDAAALAKIASYKAQVDALTAGKTIGMQAPEAGSGLAYAHGGVWGAATGGNRGGWGTIDEQGTEAVKLPSGSTVLSHADTERMVGGGGGPQIEHHDRAQRRQRSRGRAPAMAAQVDPHHRWQRAEVLGGQLMATSEEHALAALDMIEIIETTIRHEQTGEAVRLDVHNPALVLRHLAELTAALLEELYDDPLERTAALRSIVAAHAQTIL